MLDADNTVQYVGMSRRLATTVAGHAKDVPDRAVAVKFAPFPSASRDELTAVWRAWVQEVVDTTGSAPPGNLPDGQADWAPRRPPPPPAEIKLTPGKGLQDLTVGLDTLIRGVIDDNKVVAFIKGTRTAPQCGFSHSVLTMLTAQLGHGFGRRQRAGRSAQPGTAGRDQGVLGVAHDSAGEEGKEERGKGGAM